MSASLNKIQLIGNVGKDPEVRFLPSGDKVANFSLATSETWKGKDGEKKEQTQWHRVDVFGKLADIVESYVTKGSKLFVEGAMVYDEWEDKDGNKRTTSKVKLGFGARLILLGGGNGSGKSSEGQTAEKRAKKAEAAADEDVF